MLIHLDVDLAQQSATAVVEVLLLAIDRRTYIRRKMVLTAGTACVADPSSPCIIGIMHGLYHAAPARPLAKREAHVNRRLTVFVRRSFAG